MEKYWRIDDGRTGETIIIKAETKKQALNEFLDCCTENALVQEADETDLNNYGPAWGEEADTEMIKTVGDFEVGQHVSIVVPNGRRLNGHVTKLGRKYVHVTLELVNGGTWQRYPFHVDPPLDAGTPAK